VVLYKEVSVPVSVVPVWELISQNLIDKAIDQWHRIIVQVIRDHWGVHSELRLGYDWPRILSRTFLVIQRQHD